MGAWGAGIIENDDAMDWAYELEETKDDSAILEALNLVIECGDEYLESDVACRALAAAKVVSALKNSSSDYLPEGVSQWISKHQKIEIFLLVQLALDAVKRIKTDSELKELWDESDSADKWHEVVDELEIRLS
jgi:hypothetical protein